MQNQDSKNEKYNNSGIDLSQLPTKQKGKPLSRPELFNLKSFKESWQRMGKKNQIYTIIFIVSFVLIIIFLVILFSGIGGKEAVSPYIPPAEHLPPPEEEYMFPAR